MSEFYSNLSKAEIDALIEDKLKYYKYIRNFTYEKVHDIELVQGDIEFDAYISYNGFSPNYHKMYQYMGIKKGNVIYRFFNVIDI